MAATIRPSLATANDSTGTSPNAAVMSMSARSVVVFGTVAPVVFGTVAPVVSGTSVTGLIWSGPGWNVLRRRRCQQR